MPELLDPPGLSAHGPRELHYERTGGVGVLTFDFHNGAMSTAQCRRLAAALRRAVAADTRVLVLRGGETFSNGIHLNVIEAAAEPEAEAWRNINAIDDVCLEIITCTEQLVVASVGGNAAAGGVMLALGADRVILRDGVVLNPHYARMGLFGSAYWTYVLPRRVGRHRARRLTRACLPVGAAEAVGMGLVDEVIGADRHAFEDAVVAYAAALATDDPPPHGWPSCRSSRATSIDRPRRPHGPRSRSSAARRADGRADRRATGYIAGAPRDAASARTRQWRAA